MPHDVPVYRAGALAFFRTVSGDLVPCKALAVAEHVNFGRVVTFRVTAPRYGYPRGYVGTEGARWVVPRDATRGRRLVFPYVWAVDAGAVCQHCHSPLVNEPSPAGSPIWVDVTGGDVCGWNGGNEPHEPETRGGV